MADASNNLINSSDQSSAPLFGSVAEALVGYIFIR
jgi:hypothetical protein